MRKGLRYLLYFFGLILLLVIASGLWFNYNSTDFIREQIKDVISKKTQGRYQLDIDSIGVNAYTLSARVLGAHLHRDTAVDIASGIPLLDHFDVDVRLKKFKLNYFQLWDFLSDGNIDVSLIELDNPMVSIRELSHVPVDTMERDSGSLQSLVDTTKKSAPVIEVSKIKVVNGSFHFYEAGRRRALLSVKDLNTQVKRFHSEMDALVSSDGFSIDIGSVSTWVDHYLASLDVKNFHADDAGNIDIDTVDFHYVCPKPDINRLKGFQIDWLQVVVRDFALSGMDLDRFLADSIMVVDNLDIGGLFVNTYRDQADTRINMKTKPMPAEMIQSIPLPILIKEIRLKDALIWVQVKTPKASQAGSLRLTGMQGGVKNVTNIPEYLSQDPFMVASANWKINNEAPVDATLKIKLDSDNNEFEAFGNLGKTQFTSLNEFIGSQALIEFKSGNMERFEFAFSGNNHHTDGELDMEYTDLKLKKLENYQDYVKDNPHMGALVAVGNLLVRDNYLATHKDYKKGRIYFQRQKHKSIFSYLVKSLTTGVISSMGFGPKDPAAAAEKKKDRKARKAEKKKNKKKN